MQANEMNQEVLVFDKPVKGAVFRNTIGAVIRRKSDGKFLLIKWNKFGWVAPVIGGIEGGEDAFAAAEREVLEETGYRAKAVCELGNYTESYFYADHKKEWRHRHAHHILLELESEEPISAPDEEHGGRTVVWLTAEDALKQMTHFDNNIGVRRLLGLEDSLDEKKLRSL